MKKSDKVIIIVGPTASGKSDLAIKTAQKVNGEIVSADSRLIYKDFNIGTAKPSKEELDLVKHHMIDIISPYDEYSVSLYKEKALSIIRDIFDRNKVPILVGGTGFYVKTVVEGLNIPEALPNKEFREEMKAFINEYGRDALYKKLQKTDEKTALKLHHNDSLRIIRALEVYKLTGKKMSELQTVVKPEFISLYAGLNTADRKFLYNRINKRVELMLKLGLVKEVKDLIDKYGKTISLLKTLGYKEICEYLDEKCTLEEAKELIKKNTRNFAKRQLTWFRANKKIHWAFIDVDSNDTICAKVIELYNKF